MVERLNIPSAMAQAFTNDVIYPQQEVTRWKGFDVRGLKMG